MTQAPGAIPLAGPRSMPKIWADATASPAAVVVVCVPCPSESRAESGYTSPPTMALYASMKGAPPMTLWLHAKTSAAGVSGLSPYTHARGWPLGAGGGSPSAALSTSDGCSGQSPVSRSAKIVPRPAVDWPPSCAHSVGEPMKALLESVSGWLTASVCTAVTFGIASRPLAWFAGMRMATPPNTRWSERPISAVGTRASTSVVTWLIIEPVKPSYAFSSSEWPVSLRPVTCGLVAARPATPPT